MKKKKIKPFMFGVHHIDGSALTALSKDGGRSSALVVLCNNTKKTRELYNKLNKKA